jgi:hypothetical protein
MGRYYSRYHDQRAIFWMLTLVHSKDEIDFAMLFTLRENANIEYRTRNTGGGLLDFQCSSLVNR